VVNLKKQSQYAVEVEPAQTIPIPMHDNRDEAATRHPMAKKECYLKKQSQFPKGQNGVKSVIVIDYGDLYGWRQRKNKAKQSQYAGLRPEIRSANSEIRQLRWRGRMPVAPCRSGNELKGSYLKKQSQC